MTEGIYDLDEHREDKDYQDQIAICDSLETAFDA